MPSIDWSKLVNFEYWFEGISGTSSITPTLEYKGFFFWFFLGLFFTLFTIGVVIRVSKAYLHPEYPMQTRLYNWGNNLIWIGICGLAWFQFRQLSVGFLGARFWLFVLFVWFLVLVYFIVNYLVRYFGIEDLYFKSRIKSGQI